MRELRVKKDGRTAQGHRCNQQPGSRVPSWASISATFRENELNWKLRLIFASPHPDRSSSNGFWFVIPSSLWCLLGTFQFSDLVYDLKAPCQWHYPTCVYVPTRFLPEPWCSVPLNQLQGPSLVPFWSGPGKGRVLLWPLRAPGVW